MAVMPRKITIGRGQLLKKGWSHTRKNGNGRFVSALAAAFAWKRGPVQVTVTARAR